jgi:hypothetical protein
MSDDYLQLSVEQTEEFEGRVPYLYLDPKGNVTVAVGLMLPTLAAALSLPFQVNGLGGSSAATPQEVTDSWTRIHSIGPGRVAAGYDWSGAVFLEDADIDALLLKVLTGIDHHMPALYPAWSTFPVPAKLPLLDMAYNLGPAGLAGYHQMNAALNLSTPNFTLAESQCLRNKNDAAFDRRNAWTEYQFGLAAKEQSNGNGQ